MGLHRTYRKKMDRKEAAETRECNRFFKDKERARRDERMKKRLKSMKSPYHPSMMSWLSRKLEKPASRITAEDVKALLT
jgi:hypothetical protein